MKPAPRTVAIHAWGASLAVAAACASAPAPTPPAALAGSSEWIEGARATLASADADRSGALDASEVERVPCTELATLDAALRRDTHVRLGVTFGVEPGLLWRGARLGLEDHAREAFAARLETCLGRVAAPDDEAVVRAIEALDSEPASSAWDREIRKILVDAYDRDQTRVLDTTAEIDLLSCEVWRALDGATLSARNTPLLVVYGIADGYLWLANELGFAAAMRDTAAEAASACGLASD